MNDSLDGNAIVYCQGAFTTTSGKTAHGLVRFTRRYHVLAVIDSTHRGDAGALLDGKAKDIPLVPDLDEAIRQGERTGRPATHLVIGLAPDGGRLPATARATVADAVRRGLHVDSGLHDFLSDDAELVALAARHGVRLRDVRKPPPRDRLHFFSGKIAEVRARKLAVLGTDSAVGKRTTAWLLVDALVQAGWKTEMIGTGQTAWLQGARFAIVLDSLVNDFVAGEIEHAVWSAWNAERPDVLVIEGQGSLMHPAYPGGFEILAAARPDAVIVQHAPARQEYDGFPGHPVHPLERQIEAIELVGGRPVVAITVNHENMTREETETAVRTIAARTGLPTCAPLLHGVEVLVAAIQARLGARA